MTGEHPQTLAVIPARGGSQGIPRKNLREIGGRPLVCRAVDNARSARHVHRVVVSTDDDAIAAAARSAGADIVPRPAEISGAQAASESALLHALEYLAASEGYRPELLVFIQCTSPLTLPEDIDGAVARLLESGADSVFTARCFHSFVWKRDAQGAAIGVNHDPARRLLRQNREPEFLENGAVYAMRAEGFLRARHRFFGKTVIHEMPERRSWEIDELDDLLIVDALLRGGGGSVVG